MDIEHNTEIDETPENESGGLRENISSIGQIVIGELESIGGMLTGDPVTRAEGDFNADVGIIREETKQDIEESEENKDEAQT